MFFPVSSRFVRHVQINLACLDPGCGPFVLHDPMGCRPRALEARGHDMLISQNPTRPPSPGDYACQICLTYMEESRSGTQLISMCRVVGIFPSGKTATCGSTGECPQTVCGVAHLRTVWHILTCLPQGVSNSAHSYTTDVVAILLHPSIAAMFVVFTLARSLRDVPSRLLWSSYWYICVFHSRNAPSVR